MDDYKASPTFEAKAFEGCVKAYQLWFGNYKEVIFARFPNLNLAGIKVPMTEEDDTSPSDASTSAPNLDH